MVSLVSGHVSGSLSFIFCPCLRGLPRPLYAGGADQKQAFLLSRIRESALISACASTQLALLYSLSNTASTEFVVCLQTCWSCAAALGIGDSPLLIRSCSNGSAQLLWSSGIQLHPDSCLPTKKPRQGKLDNSERQHNRSLARLRIVVEHVNLSSPF
jgi:hypothetical protein